MRSLLSNIKRPIVKEISFTARCSGMADLSIYIYIYIKRPIVKQIDFTATCSGMADLYIYMD